MFDKALLTPIIVIQFYVIKGIGLSFLSSRGKKAHENSTKKKFKYAILAQIYHQNLNYVISLQKQYNVYQTIRLKNS